MLLLLYVVADGGREGGRGAGVGGRQEAVPAKPGRALGFHGEAAEVDGEAESGADEQGEAKDAAHDGAAVDAAQAELHAVPGARRHTGVGVLLGRQAGGAPCTCEVAGVKQSATHGFAGAEARKAGITVASGGALRTVVSVFVGHSHEAVARLMPKDARGGGSRGTQLIARGVGGQRTCFCIVCERRGGHFHGGEAANMTSSDASVWLDGDAAASPDWLTRRRRGIG